MQPFVDGKRPAKGSVLVPDPRKTLSPIFPQAEKHASCNPSDEGLACRLIARGDHHAGTP